ncbi:hypothetical protein [uncultured Dubosiella sp.]|uniref:hypothetical protein n=1 Tax=uncultured Dubosiella sp. TaxID=1937011 RepID=UPI002608F414|nr:hypothetical protein [uncultured Dubosiella sp.]
MDQKEGKKRKETYDAKLGIYPSMVHYVAKTLKLDPNEIFDSWSVPQLIITYGVYANQESYRIHQEIKSMNAHSKKKQKVPELYAVKFIPKEKIA